LKSLEKLSGGGGRLYRKVRGRSTTSLRTKRGIATEEKWMRITKPNAVGAQRLLTSIDLFL
jgi:hypothetical protein